MNNINPKIVELYQDSLAFGRVVLLDRFLKFILINTEVKKLNVAVIGGFDNEPEVEILKKSGYEVSIDHYGISETSKEFDLNIKNNKDKVKKKYDLVICCQVLEHVWNINNFFHNLELFKEKDTLIYINFPKSNKFHSVNPQKPKDFNSTGYSKYFILNNIEDSQLEAIEIEELGSERLYKSIHVLQTWYNYKEINKCFRAEKKDYIKYFSSFYNLINFLLLKKSSNKITNDPKFTSETYAFLK